jgi:hypothetical protein
MLPPPLVELRSKHDPDNPRLVYALLVPASAASATAIILFWMLRAHFALPLPSSVLTTLAFAFGTMTWKYGSLLYSHATSGLAVMLTVALILRWQTCEVSKTSQVFLGLVLGASVLMEYTNIVFVALAGLYWFWQTFSPSPLLPRSQAQAKIVRLFCFLFGGLLPALFLLWYNTVNFGGPLKLSTFNADTTRWPQNLSFFADFATPIWVGLPAMLFYGSDNQGLFWLAPIALLGLAGLKGLWQRSRREFALIVGGFTTMLLLFSTSTTFNPFTNDGRYITPFLGLWFVAVGFGLSRMQRFAAPAISPFSFFSPLIIYGLLFLSIRNQIMHIAFSWGHDLNLAILRPWAAAPENLAALWQAVFPNALNLPLWWGVLGVGWLAWRLWRARPKAQQKNFAGADT